MSVVLSEHLPLLASAPDGIQKLRGLILELAVRGKLVPQDPKDEPASELLKRIVQERARLGAERTCKKSKAMPLANDDIWPFELPNGWQWSRVGDLASVVRGVSYEKSQASDVLLYGYLPLLRGHNINKLLNFEDLVFVPANLISADQLIRRGDTVIAMSSGSAHLVGKAAQAVDDVDFGFGAFCGLIRAHSVELHQYFRFFFQTPLYRNRVAGHGKGIGINNLQKGALLALECPVPPLAEQHRIVAKVDELMTLCDRLEAEQADAEAAHTRLVETLLGTLTQSTDAVELAANWQRLDEHFHTLFTTEASLDALKQTILQLAVMGKLVPQDSNDEPASELLKRIAKERTRLEADGTCKKAKPVSPVNEDEQAFKVPTGWTWARFSQVAAVNGRLVDSQDYPDAMQVAPDSIEKGTGRLITRRTVREAGIRGPNQQFQAGQLLYSKIRPSLSKAVIVNFDGLCSADMYPLDAYIEPRFLLNQILSEVFLEQVRVAENRVKMPKLNQESLNVFLVCIPPLAEQHRIIAKVDELMALCDRLKADLAESRKRQERLAATLIDAALQAA